MELVVLQEIVPDVVASNATYEFEVRPCRNDSLIGDQTSVVSATPEQAEYWGVYRRPLAPNGQGVRLAKWLHDALTREEAVAYAQAQAASNEHQLH